MRIITSAVLVGATLGLAVFAQVSVANKTDEVSSTAPSTSGEGADQSLTESQSQPATEGAPSRKRPGYVPTGTGAAWAGGAATRPAVGQVSVLCFKQPDPKEIGETMEDVATLSFLLARNLQHAVASGAHDYKLGIPMLTTGNQAVSASYVQGFGAILKMQVRFPVAGLDQEAPPAEPAVKTGSEWEQARRELLEGENPTANSWDSARNSNGREPYDSKRVHTLKRRVLSLLKNASNIRHMDGNEWIILKVVGPPNPSGAGMGWNGQEPVGENSQDHFGQAPDPGRAGKTGKKIPLRSASNQATVLTLRVKKSDADAFASGALSAEQFIKNAEVAAYFNPIQGSSSDEATWGMANGAGFGLQRK